METKDLNELLKETELTVPLFQEVKIDGCKLRYCCPKWTDTEYDIRINVMKDGEGSIEPECDRAIRELINMIAKQRDLYIKNIDIKYVVAYDTVATASVSLYSI